MNNPRTRLKAGTNIYGYTVKSYLDRGGFALTYLGTDGTCDVLIKEFFPLEYAVRDHDRMYPPVGCETEFGRWLNAFIREAQILVKLSGIRGVIGLKDFFEVGGTAYIITDYLRGATLSDYIADSGGKLPIDEAMLLIGPLMDTLSEIHARGVLHLDVSPDNILIDKNLDVYLIDFGAAAFDGSMAELTSQKDGYSPPELYSPHFLPDVRSDVYSVAATLYRAIVGFAPPSAPERARGHALAVVPESIEDALLAGLSLSPARRPASIRQFARLLQA